MKKISGYLSIGLASLLVFSSANLQHVYASSSTQTSATKVTSTIDSSEIVNIPDTFLKEAIANELNISPNNVITKKQLRTLTHLEAGYITSLEGLQYATHLKELVLYEGKVSDLSPLESLTSLNKLDVSSNLISDLSPVANLRNLTHLYLGENNITDISSLAYLTKLEELYLSDNHIANLAPLSKLTHLLYLYLGENNITDLSNLVNLTNLEILALGGNNISNISYLSKMTDLHYLSLNKNNISNISSLSNLTNLEELYLSDNHILTFTPLRPLENLHYLEPFNNPGEDTVKPTLSGVGNKIVKRNKTFHAKSGVTAKDNIDGNITKYIKVTGNINVKKVGKYTLTYMITDTSGNKTTKKRVITVK